jgi:hypothetical protein
VSTVPLYHRIYIAGPYSAPTRAGVEVNIHEAMLAAHFCMAMGHDAHCPHTATDPIARFNDVFVSQGEPTGIDYERWMRLDLGILRSWASALFLIAPSPGANRELALAEELGLRIFRSHDEVPDLRKVAAP